MQIDVTDEHWAIIAGFLPIEDRRELFALCRASVQSPARKYFFAQCTWCVPPIEWLAAQLLSILTMKHVVKHVVIEFSWQQAYLAELTALESVHLGYYSTEETFVVSPLLPVGLKSLTILKYFSLVSVAAVARLVDLEEFSARVRRIDNVEMLGTLPRLRKLTLGIMNDPEADLQWISDLVHLREIRLNDMNIHQGVRLPADKLETFKLRVCDLSSLDFLMEAAPQLTNFSWVNSDLQNIIPKYDKERLLRSLTKIEILRVRRDTLMNSLVPIANLATMKVLEICEMEINDLSALANLVHLEELTVYAPPNADWSSIIQCKKLRMIDQGNLFDVQNDSSARALQQLPLLRYLKDPFRMSSKYPLLQITSLEVYCSEDKTFSFEPGCCPNIESLTVRGGMLVVQNVADNFPMLKELSCSVYAFVDDLDPLGLLTRLEYLQLDWEQQDTEDMSFLLEMVHLKKLTLRDAKISELSILRNLKQLQHLWIGGDSIEDISVLAELKQLQYLSLHEAPVRDVTCLYGHPHLRVVWLSQSTVCSPLMRVYGKSLPNITFFSHTNCAECLEAFGH